MWDFIKTYHFLLVLLQFQYSLHELPSQVLCNLDTLIYIKQMFTTKYLAIYKMDRKRGIVNRYIHVGRIIVENSDHNPSCHTFVFEDKRKHRTSYYEIYELKSISGYRCNPACHGSCEHNF